MNAINSNWKRETPKSRITCPSSKRLPQLSARLEQPKLVENKPTDTSSLSSGTRDLIRVHSNYEDVLLREMLYFDRF